MNGETITGMLSILENVIQRETKPETETLSSEIKMFVSIAEHFTVS